MKILVLAYQLSPTKGSEFSVAWNYVMRMSQYNSLTVLYGVSGNNMGDCDEMNDWLENNRLNNVKFVQISPDKICTALNFFNVHNMFRYSFYVAYRRWQKLAYKKAKNLIEAEKYDLIHYLGPIGGDQLEER